MDRGLIIRKLGALMQNLQALTVFFTIDFGWGSCAPSDFDPTPEIKGSRGRRRCSEARRRGRFGRYGGSFGLGFGAKGSAQHV